MVLERFLELKSIENRSYLVFFLSIFYVFFGYVISKIFFGGTVSVAMLFLCTLLLVPSLINLLRKEEIAERTFGLKHFFSTHRKIVLLYFFVFLGIFGGYLALGSMTPLETTFEFQLDYLTFQQGVGPETLTAFKQGELGSSMQHFFGILFSNLEVLLLCFILSVFYGAGAIFLIVLNASIFASFILYLLRHFTDLTNFGMFFLFYMVHLIPEIAGFLLAALAGGVLSVAIMREKFLGIHFQNVTKDAFLLLLLAILLIVLGAFLEVFVTRNVLHAIL
ncbi:stage II sporulation protein M [Candidatus Woesearchaeota archaeon]|nr:stage II sporulation protein M [Candidatus Woesearchaeota archaeon]MBW3014197.1 stage II sporulation protein M [Candidatus Woesearchaeota archaeon]